MYCVNDPILVREENGAFQKNVPFLVYFLLISVVAMQKQPAMGTSFSPQQTVFVLYNFTLSHSICSIIFSPGFAGLRVTSKEAYPRDAPGTASAPLCHWQ